MSGPTTVLFGVDPITILLSAAAIRAAQAVAAGYEESAILNAKNQADRDVVSDRQKRAILQGQKALLQEVGETEARFSQLIKLAEQLGVADLVSAARQVRPDADDSVTMVAYAGSLKILADELESHLKTESARRMGRINDRPDVISMPAELAAIPDQPATPPVSQRLLERIAHIGPVPEHMQAIARELDNTPSGERAGLLLNELRARIEAHIELSQKRKIQEATATVVDQTLKDLGYQVEEIGNTLFVEGGVVHFRRQGWGEYMVRMRVNAEAGTANFNVIRSIDDGNSKEISVRDHLAEDRWCAEFPKLKEALEARGAQLQVTRLLAAGEVPVQLVESGKLPKFADEAATAAIKQLQSLQLRTK